jgi:hypothetical protein
VDLVEDIDPAGRFIRPHDRHGPPHRQVSVAAEKDKMAGLGMQCGLRGLEAKDILIPRMGLLSQDRGFLQEQGVPV